MLTNSGKRKEHVKLIAVDEFIKCIILRRYMISRLLKRIPTLIIITN